MTWFTLTIISIFTLSTYYFLSKKILNKSHIDSRFYGAMLQFATGLVALPVAIMTGFEFEITKESILLLIVMMSLYTIGPSFYYTGLKHVELSKTTVLDSSTAVWIVIFGLVLLSEEFSLAKIMGVGMILAAILIITVDKSFKLNLNKYEAFVLLSSVFYSLAAIMDNKLLEFSNAFSYLSISFSTAGLAMLITNIPRIKTVGINNILNKDLLITCFVSGAFLATSYGLIFLAYEKGGEVSKIYPLVQTESVIIPLIGIVFLKERSGMIKKIIAAVIAMIGVLIIR